MSNLISGVTRLVRAMAPDYDWRYTDAQIKQLIHMADLAVRENADMEWASYDRTLNDGQAWYTVPSEIVQIKTVMYAPDGLNFQDRLMETTVQEMDLLGCRWQDDTGPPSRFLTISCPGIDNYFYLRVWPYPSTTTGEKIRINYTKVRESVSGIEGLEVPDRVQQNVYLPYVLAMLRQGEDPQEAEAYIQEFKRGLVKVRADYQHPTKEV
jgi:hypothetical protein